MSEQSTQQYSSAKTSINSKKVPAIFNKVVWLPGTRNLDYGGGKYDTATEYLRKRGCDNQIYDPYNRSAEHNLQVLHKAPYNTATISNVLNVISEPAERLKVVNSALALVEKGGIIYITVYEGNKSGKGAKSKNDCWQENRRLASYATELRVFNPVMKKGMIIIQKEDK